MTGVQRLNYGLIHALNHYNLSDNTTGKFSVKSQFITHNSNKANPLNGTNHPPS